VSECYELHVTYSTSRRHMPDVLVRLGVSRDDRHSRLAPSAASEWRGGALHTQQATGIHLRYMFAYYDCCFIYHLSSHNQLRSTTRNNKTPQPPSQDFPQPNRHHAHSHRSRDELSRMSTKNIKSNIQTDTFPELLPRLRRHRHSSGSMVNLGSRYVPATARPQRRCPEVDGRRDEGLA